MILEVCANSYESAINAENAGAHRIELCENLTVGGVTPNYKLAKKVITELIIPVFIFELTLFVSSSETSSKILRLDPIFFPKFCITGNRNVKIIQYFTITNHASLTDDVKYHEKLLHRTPLEATLTKCFLMYFS